jgi:phage-related minor tail protein
VAFDSFAQEMQKTSTATRQQVDAVKEGAKTWENFEKIIRKLQLSFVAELGPSLKAINNSLGNETYNRISMLGKVFDFLARNVYSTYKAMQSIVVLFEQLAGQSVIAQTYGESAAGMAQTAKLKQETERRLAALRQELKDFEDFQKGNTGIRTDVYPKGGRPKVGDEVIRQTVVGVDSKAEALRAKAEAERKKQEAEAEALLKRRLALTAQGYEEEQRAIKESADEWAKYVEEQAKAAQSQSEYFRLSNQQLDRDREMMLLEKTNLNLRSEELNYAQQILSIRNKYADRIYEIEKQENLTREKKDEFMQREIELRDRSIQQAKEALDITRQSREGTMADGFTKGFDEFVRDMPTRMEMGKTAFNSLMSSMDSALRQFVQTGKINFKDLVKSMIQELIYLESKAKMMDMFKSMKGGGGGGGGGIMDMLGGLFGGGGGGMTGAQHNMLAASFNAPAADGGDLAANKIGLVGERGPELFVPRTAGTIIPNNQLSSMGGGSTVNYNGPYIASMNAIDTQSGTQFLAKNKNTIWAAYQSANRGVPVSR